MSEISPFLIAPRALEICRTLKAAGYSAYVVGGCVRDTLLKRDVKDWDITTSALPQQVVELFPHTVPTGIEHGTVTVILQDEHYEVTTFRGEGAYSNSRHPDWVKFGVDLREDLARRDFTINAMAYDPIADELEDHFNGRGDLEDRCIRAVGDPSKRFEEDGLRVMRAIRFASTLGFEVHWETEMAIHDGLGALNRVSKERIRDELEKLLSSPNPSIGLTIARRRGVLVQILPELLNDDGASNYHVERLPKNWRLRFARLLHQLSPEVVESIATRLKFSTKDRRYVTDLCANYRFPYATTWSDANLRFFLHERKIKDILQDVLTLRCSVFGNIHQHNELLNRFSKILAENPPLEVRDLAINGMYVMNELNMNMSPGVGEALNYLLEQAIMDPTINNKKALLRQLHVWKESGRG